MFFAFFFSCYKKKRSRSYCCHIQNKWNHSGKKVRTSLLNERAARGIQFSVGAVIEKNCEIRSVSSILFPIYNLYPSATHLFAPRNLRLSAEAFNIYHQVYHLLFVRAKIKRRACFRYAVKNQRVRLVFPTNPLSSLSVRSIFSIFLLFIKFFFQRPTFSFVCTMA